MSAVVYQGDVAPAACVFKITPGTTGVDLSTVTLGTIHVRKPNGTQTTWTTVLSNQTSTTLTATHAFASNGSDLDVYGLWAAWIVLTIPAGALRVPPQVLTVKAPWEQ